MFFGCFACPGTATFAGGMAAGRLQMQKQVDKAFPAVQSRICEK
jgi:hypothetical protein